MEEINQSKHLLDDFITNLTEENLHNALQTLELDPYGSVRDGIARLRRRVAGQYHENDFVLSTIVDPDERKEHRQKALNAFLAQFSETVDIINSTENAAAAGDKNMEPEISIIQRADNLLPGAVGGQGGGGTAQTAESQLAKDIDSSNVTMRRKRDKDARKSIAEEMRQSESEKNKTQNAKSAEERDGFINVTLPSGESFAIPRDIASHWRTDAREAAEQQMVDELINSQTIDHPLSKSRDKRRQEIQNALNPTNDAQKSRLQSQQNAQNNNHSGTLSKNINTRDKTPVSQNIAQHINPNSQRTPAITNQDEAQWSLEYRGSAAKVCDKNNMAQNSSGSDRPEGGALNNNNWQDYYSMMRNASASGQNGARNQNARDLTKTIASWNLKFSGKDGDNIDEFFMRIAEYRQVAALQDSDLLRAVPMLLDLPALNVYRTKLEGWRNWAEFEKELRDQYQDDLYTERLADEARARTHKINEPVRDYINAMLLIYNKMRQQPAREIMLERIYRNMRAEFHPFMREHLHADIKTFTQRAVEIGKAFDAGKASAQPGAAQTAVAAVGAQGPPASSEKIEIAAAAIATREDITKIVSAEIAKLKDAIKSSVGDRLANISGITQNSHQGASNKEPNADGQQNNFNNGNNRGRGQNSRNNYRGRGRGRNNNNYNRNNDNYRHNNDQQNCNNQGNYNSNGGQWATPQQQYNAPNNNNNYQNYAQNNSNYQNFAQGNYSGNNYQHQNFAQDNYNANYQNNGQSNYQQNNQSYNNYGNSNNAGQQNLQNFDSQNNANYSNCPPQSNENFQQPTQNFGPNSQGNIEPDDNGFSQQNGQNSNNRNSNYRGNNRNRGRGRRNNQNNNRTFYNSNQSAPDNNSQNYAQDNANYNRQENDSGNA